MLRFLKVLLPVFAVLFFLFVFLSVWNIFRNPLSNQSSEPSAGIQEQYHYAFFLPDSDYFFFKDLKEGARNAAGNMNSAISFHAIDNNSASLRMAKYSGYDGIAIYSYEQSGEQLEDITQVRDAGIPIVFIENAPLSGGDTYLIGTNSYESGKGIGRIAGLSQEEQINLTVIFSEKNPGLLYDANLVEMGIKEILGSRLQTLNDELTGLNPLDAEILAYSILQAHDTQVENSQVRDIIVLTDLNDTLVTIQAIIDMNLVGEVGVIGFGDDEAVQEYIEKDVMLGSIVRNPYRIGYSSIMALKEISEIGYTSAYVDTGISILTNETRALSPRVAGTEDVAE